MAKSWTIGEALQFGWNTMKENFALVLGVMLVFIAIQVVPILFQDLEPADAMLALVAMLVSMILSLGAVRIALNLYEKRRGDLGDLFSQTSLFPDYLVATIVYVLIVIAGLILLIIPGIVWAIKYSYYGYYIVDKRKSPFDAIKASGQATKGHKWHILGLWLVIVGVNIVGALALGVGLFLTVPTTSLACAYVYKQLASAESSEPKAVTKKKKE
jgi:uncharacterized membrane protein